MQLVKHDGESDGDARPNIDIRIRVQMEDLAERAMDAGGVLGTHFLQLDSENKRLDEPIPEFGEIYIAPEIRSRVSKDELKQLLVYHLISIATDGAFNKQRVNLYHAKSADLLVLFITRPTPFDILQLYRNALTVAIINPDWYQAVLDEDACCFLWESARRDRDLEAQTSS
jgi:hypothetical protein